MRIRYSCVGLQHPDGAAASHNKSPTKPRAIQCACTRAVAFTSHLSNGCVAALWYGMVWYGGAARACVGRSYNQTRASTHFEDRAIMRWCAKSLSLQYSTTNINGVSARQIIGNRTGVRRKLAHLPIDLQFLRQLSRIGLIK